jgi:SAM-dependent methyltransferase
MEAEMNDMVQAHNEKARSVWNAPGGRYDEISRSIADAIEHAVTRLEPAAGERVLDLATGTGWASRIVAQRFPGAVVTGVDIAEQMLEYARATAAKQELAIEYRHGDAEKLPFADGSLDAVVSTFGVMFAGRPEAAASELARVVKRGGRVVLATWKDDSNVANMFGVMKKFMPAPAQPAPPSPFAWGRRERLQELFGASFDLSFEEGTNRFRYGSGEKAWNLWVNHYGPTKSLAASLDDGRREELKSAMVAWHETFASSLGYEQPRTYVITRAIRKSA